MMNALARESVAGRGAGRRWCRTTPWWRACWLVCAVAGSLGSALAQGVRGTGDYFRIAVVDEATGRGVPLVELQTGNKITHVTDSHGLIAFHEPGLIDQTVFFHVRSHGYEFPKDGFGNRGVALPVSPGGKAVVKLKRLNVAERLYRVTGAGIYRDTVLLGERPPTRAPVLNGQVFGQDSVVTAPYRGKLYWFWGDTDRPKYPLGNFAASGATSELPENGGLDPAVGVDLKYFVDESGFTKGMCPTPGPGLRWIESLVTVPGVDGRQLLAARYGRVKSLDEMLGWGLAVFNDDREVFESVAEWDSKAPVIVAHPFRVQSGGREYWYIFPTLRVPATGLSALTNLNSYENFTCLAAKAEPGEPTANLERDAQGRPVYRWRAGLDAIRADLQDALVNAGKLKPEENWHYLLDLERGTRTKASPIRGSVCWNDYRRRWIGILWGELGETWFAEADTPAGPWAYARRIVSHDRYTFYNPTQHPFFDQDGGRIIYFEGTYTAAFSAAPAPTPRYDYNQVMYRLTLDDPRLALPAPVYRVRVAGGAERLMMREDVEAAQAWDRIESVAFFAVPPSRKSEGLVPVYAEVANGHFRLATEPPGTNSRPLFLALSLQPPESATATPDSPALRVLREIRLANGNARYAVEDAPAGEPFATPLCRVWRNPQAALILDHDARPVRAGYSASR